jgi:DNA-binding Xre family transcriptional regulator
MNNKNREIFEIISNYGSFAKPFLNFMILKTKHDGWNHLFKSLEYSWKSKRKKALEEIERGLKHNNTKTLKYLLLAKELYYSAYLRDYENSKKIYLFLKENFSYIPKKSRKLVSSVLINVENILNLNEKTRLWSREYELDPSTEIFITLGKAREKIKEDEYSEAWKYFERSLILSKKIPHRMGIITGLNDWSWYLKDFDLEKSRQLSYELMFYSGYYFEEMENRFGVFDTYFEINKWNIESLYSYAPIINYFWEKLPESGKRNSKENYESMFNILRKFIISEKSTYENTEELRNYLKNYITNLSETSKKVSVSRKSLSSIINGKVLEIRGDTLKKIVLGLNIVPNINSPEAVINEYGKIYLENTFRESIEELEKLDFEKREKIFINTYIACIYKPKMDIEQIINFNFVNDFIVKWFIIEMIKGNEFINARKKLVNHFFSKMKKNAYNNFIITYLNLNKKEKEMIDVYVRNYSRYDIKWNIRIELPGFLKSFVEKYSLKKMPATLAYWYYEKGSDRRKLINILNKF